MESNRQAPIFAGTEKRSLDEKARVTVPARWRYPEMGELYAIPDPRQPLLLLLTGAELQNIAEALEGMEGVAASDRRQFTRQFFAQATPCPMDRQGRVVLPSAACQALDLSGEVVLIGGGARIEVWHPDRWADQCVGEQQAYTRVADMLGL